MLKGFKEFILRGNVVDLAVGVVIGTAFTGLVGSLTKAFLEPLIRLLTLLILGKDKIESSVWTVRGVPFEYTLFVNGLITFLLTAIALYFFVVMPLNKLAERRKKGVEPEPEAPSEEVLLLTDIRDALRARD